MKEKGGLRAAFFACDRIIIVLTKDSNMEVVIMKKFAIGFAAVTAFSSASFAQYNGYGRSNSYNYGTGSNPNSHYVQPHYRSNGSQVDGHYQTNPNSYRSDNFGASGNYNPYNGTYGGQRKSNAW